MRSVESTRLNDDISCKCCNCTNPTPFHSNSNGTLMSAASASSNFAMIGSRAPPRPAPSMVRYSDEDDDSAKGYDENPDDSDSLTEKPSEISSSTSSQVRKNSHRDLKLQR